MNFTWEIELKQAHANANSALFPEMLAACERIVEHNGNDLEAILGVGTLLLNFGYLTQALIEFERAQVIAPNDQRALINLANLARNIGNHVDAKRLYAKLQTRLPNNHVIRRNGLLTQEYDPVASKAQRLEQARAWGDWAIAQAGGPRPRPMLKHQSNQPLRIGYVSADLCQHTVGLLVKDVIKGHDSAYVTAFAYHAGQVNDQVTKAIRASCTLRNVASITDIELADLIRQDGINVLVDLSGHTAGSRLTVFAHRPAPVQVSWLGYFATTGLNTIDAVLLDEWHAPIGTEAQFIEPIIRLPSSRLCYQPVTWAPEVSPLPCAKNGYITFGSFNNTSKLNADVFDVWAKVLKSVPDSRLVLKWRTLVDKPFCERILLEFSSRGINPQRIELRPASFHVDVLKQYADIDIALDPFPFTGGLTSCEALWMGVPVITLPKSRVVSRQTFAFLSIIELAELAAKDADDYVRIAKSLAQDRARLSTLRNNLRDKMQASSLMDVKGFTRMLENVLHKLYFDIANEKGKNNMANISIDNKDYDIDKLSDEAKAQLGSIQYVDQELARLQAQAAALQTARMAYANALKDALPKGKK